MKILKPVLVVFAALVLLAGGFFAGSMFSASRLQSVSVVPTQGWGYGGTVSPNNIPPNQQGCCGAYGLGMNGWYDENWRSMHDWNDGNCHLMHRCIMNRYLSFEIIIN